MQVAATSTTTTLLLAPFSGRAARILRQLVQFFLSPIPALLLLVYCLNKFWFSPIACAPHFFRAYLNDLLVAPCLFPFLNGIVCFCTGDSFAPIPNRAVTLYFVFQLILVYEILLPALRTGAVSDPLDGLCYAISGIVFYQTRTRWLRLRVPQREEPTK